MVTNRKKKLNKDLHPTKVCCLNCAKQFASKYDRDNNVIVISAGLSHHLISAHTCYQYFNSIGYLDYKGCVLWEKLKPAVQLPDSRQVRQRLDVIDGSDERFIANIGLTATFNGPAGLVRHNQTLPSNAQQIVDTRRFNQQTMFNTNHAQISRNNIELCYKSLKQDVTHQGGDDDYTVADSDGESSYASDPSTGSKCVVNVDNGKETTDNSNN